MSADALSDALVALREVFRCADEHISYPTYGGYGSTRAALWLAVLAVRETQSAEMIAAAAIRVDGEVWTLPRPARHHILAKAWSDAHFRDGKPAPLHEHDSGFVTSTGRFVDRAEAETIARASGQIEGPLIGGVLTSEDLW